MIPKTNYSQTLSITNVQRDSIYNKIERGKINAERVKHLKGALYSCDSVKSLQVTYMKIVELQSIKKDSIINNNNTIIKLLKENVKAEKKRGRKKAFGWFLKGAALGAGGILILSIL